MPPLDQDRPDSPLLQLVNEARAGDATTDHEHVGTVGQCSGVTL
jgi:hypothetical protein